MRINWTRVILGGLAAGVVVNIVEYILNGVVLADTWAQAMRAIGKPGEFSGGQIAIFNVIGFAIGIFTVWLYSAIRPRYGAGPKTAVCAGAAVWFIGYLMPTIGQLMMGLWPMGATLLALVVGLGEICIAAQLGGWIYKEEAAGSGKAAAAAR